LSIASLPFSILLLVGVRVSQLQEGYNIAKLEQEKATLLEQTKAMQLEWAVLKRPERIRKLAAQKLQLGAPDSSQMRRINGGIK
jgi:cell division protein FtsL